MRSAGCRFLNAERIAFYKVKFAGVTLHQNAQSEVQAGKIKQKLPVQQLSGEYSRLKGVKRKLIDIRILYIVPVKFRLPVVECDQAVFIQMKIKQMAAQLVKGGIAEQVGEHMACLICVSDGRQTHAAIALKPCKPGAGSGKVLGDLGLEKCAKIGVVVV